MKRKGALFLTTLASVLWGLSFPAIKIGLVFIDPYLFVLLEIFVSFVLVLAISFVTHSFRIALAKERLVWFLGLLNGFAYLFQYLGINYTTASKASLFVNLSAVWVGVLSWGLLKEELSKKKVVGIISGVVGVFLITTNFDLLQLSQGMFIGDGLVLLAGILWSFFIIYNKKLVGTHSISQILPWIFLVTILPLSLTIPFLNSNSLWNLAAEAWIIILFNAIFLGLIPYYLWVKGLQHISPIASTIILSTETIVAVLFSFFFLRETLSVILWIGAPLIFLAILLVSSR